MDNSLNLFINGPIQFNDNITLIVEGRSGNNFNLFIKTENIIYNNQNIELSTIGSIEGVTNYQQLTLPLSIKSSLFNKFEFYLKVDEVGYLNNQKDFFIDGAYSSYFNNIQLFLQNDAKYNSFDLLITGTGTNENWYPKNSNLNMYIERDYEALTGSLSMYILSNENFNDSLDLITYGKTEHTNSMYLFNAAGIDKFNKNITFYIHGF